jgi:hypothetical protein
MGKERRFFLSRNELDKSKELQNYYLYLVSYENSIPKVVMIKCNNIDSSDKFDLVPSNYEIRIKY